MTVCTITLTFAAPVAGRLFPKIDSRILLSAMGIIVILGYAQLSFGQAAWQWWLAGLLYGVGGSGILDVYKRQGLPVPGEKRKDNVRRLSCASDLQQ